MGGDDSLARREEIALLRRHYFGQRRSHSRALHRRVSQKKGLKKEERVERKRFFYRYQAGEIAIKAGEWKLGYDLKHEEPHPFQIVNVSVIANHPGYYPESARYDLAILFLAEKIRFDQHVDAICLGHEPQPSFPLSKCISTGWGKVAIQGCIYIYI